MRRNDLCGEKYSLGIFNQRVMAIQRAIILTLFLLAYSSMFYQYEEFV